MTLAPTTSDLLVMCVRKVISVRATLCPAALLATLGLLLPGSVFFPVALFPDTPVLWLLAAANKLAYECACSLASFAVCCASAPAVRATGFSAAVAPSAGGMLGAAD